MSLSMFNYQTKAMSRQIMCEKEGECREIQSVHKKQTPISIKNTKRRTGIATQVGMCCKLGALGTTLD